MLMNRRLYRCRHDRRLAGVAAGVAEFFDLDPTLVRLLFFLSIFVGGLGLLLYIGMAIIVPLEPASADEAAREAAVEPEGHRHAARGGGRGTIVVGAALILFGGLALVDSLLPACADAERFLVPAFFVGVGALLVATAVRREPAQQVETRESVEA
jgi:phage shock protein C